MKNNTVLIESGMKLHFYFELDICKYGITHFFKETLIFASSITKETWLAGRTWSPEIKNFQ